MTGENGERARVSALEVRRFASYGALVVLAATLGCQPNDNTSDDVARDVDSDVSTTVAGDAALGKEDDTAAKPGARDGGLVRSQNDSGTQHDGGARDASDTSSSARWVSYGFDLENSQHNPLETRLNASNVAGLKEQWRIRVPSGATSTPVVYDGTVYFGAWDGNAYAADAATGEIRWQRKVTDMLVRSTPLVTADRVYVAAGRNLVSLDRADGTTLFETELSMHPETVLDSSPKLVDGLVIIGVSSVENTFTKDDYTSIGAVIALAADSGEQVWRVATTGEGPGRCVGGAGVSVWSSAAFDEDLGLLYIGTGQTHEPPSSTCGDSLLAIHYRRDHPGERVAWIAQYTQEDTYAVSPLLSRLEPDADIGAAPNLFEAAGRPLVGAGDKGGSYRAFDRRTGELLWRTDLDVGLNTQVGGVMTTAAVHAGTIYVGSNHVDGDSLSALLNIGVDPNNVATIYAIDAATGETRWSFKLPTTMMGSFAIAGDLLYHPAADGTLYARELATGNEVWSTKLVGPIGVGPSVVDGRVYVSAGFGIGVATTSPSAVGAIVASFGFEDGPPKVWEAAVEPPTPMTKDECVSAVEQASDWPTEQAPSAECSSCLCDCNATAAGHCDTCWLQAPCTATLCWPAAGPDLRTCMELVCVSKLLPSYVFERSVEVAPCAIECAQPCGF